MSRICRCGKQLEGKSSLTVVKGREEENVCSRSCVNDVLAEVFDLLEATELEEEGAVLFSSYDELMRVASNGRGCPCVHVEHGEDECKCLPAGPEQDIDHIGGCFLNRDRPVEKFVVRVLERGEQLFSSCLYHAPRYHAGHFRRIDWRV